MQRWWDYFFDADYAPLLALRSEAELMQTVTRICALGKLPPGSQLLDQCCGTGALSGAFAQQGFVVAGVDISGSYIAQASNRYPDCRFFHADACGFVSALACDAVINWYTSFGYSDDDATNQRMVQSAYASLKPGGAYLIETFNPAYVLRHFEESQEYVCRVAEQDIHVRKRCSIDTQRGMFVSRWVITQEGRQSNEKYGESRMYSAQDLTKMLRRCGFEAIEVCATHDAALSEEHARMIVLGRKGMNAT